MKKIVMTDTDLHVSRLALGTAQFGSGLSKEIAFAQLDAYFDMGGNLIDTAHVYGNWIRGLTSPSEETIGEWLKRSGKRNKIILSSKGGHPDLSDMSAMQLGRNDLDKDLEESLIHLGTDHIDLYFFHRDDPSIPVAELLLWMENKVKEGKIRWYGCSNWSLKRMVEAQDFAKEHGLHGFSCNQEMGCLADVNTDTLPPSNVVIDKEIRAYHQKTKLSFMAYMSLARGYFFRRYNDLPITEESRANYTNPSNDRIAAKLKELCSGQYGVLDYCWQYVVQQDFPSIPVAGFSSVSQMKQAAAAINRDMPRELLAQIASLKELQ